MIVGIDLHGRQFMGLQQSRSKFLRKQVANDRCYFVLVVQTHIRVCRINHKDSSNTVNYNPLKFDFKLNIKLFFPGDSFVFRLSPICTSIYRHNIRTEKLRQETIQKSIIRTQKTIFKFCTLLLDDLANFWGKYGRSTWSRFTR